MNSPSHILPTILRKILPLALLLCAQIALAQKPDSITHHYDSLAKIKLSALDSSDRFNNKVDSVQLRINNILNPNLNNLTSKFRTKRVEKQDSLRATKELDAMKRGLTHKIDSLKEINQPTDLYTRKLDSLNNISPQKYIEMANAKAQSVENKVQSVEDKVNKPVQQLEEKINKPIDRAESKINQPIQQAEDKITKPIDNIESKVNDKLNVMRKEGGEDANLPGNLDTNVSLDKAGVPGAKDISLDKAGVPGVNNLSEKAGLPNTDLNKGLDLNGKNPLNTDNPLSKIDNPIAGQTSQLGELKDKVNDIKGAPQQQLDKVKSIDEIQTAKEKVGSLNTATDKIQSYQGDVKNIANGDLGEVKEIPDAIEKKAGSLDEIKDLQKQTGEMTKAQGELDKIKGYADQANDPEALKKTAKQEITKRAIDHFKGKEEVLQQAMDKLSKIKQKYPDAATIKDISKRPPNPMKGKPLIERIVPGITLQFLKAHNVILDINPVISYRFTGRINAGVGWNERLSFDKWNKLAPADRIYGPRVFGSFVFKKGFGVKAEIEKMNTIIPSSAIGGDGSRHWVWSAFVGLKKDYSFIGRVKGNVQILYNVYDDHDNSPYFDRFNVRMGFEFPMKKVKKPVGK